MKAKVQKLIGTAVLGLAMFSNSLPAWGGLKYFTEVFVGPISSGGHLVAARYSADADQFIGCFLEYPTTSPTNGYAHCNAREKNGEFSVCFTTDPRMTKAIRAITDSSYISYDVNSSGSCTALQIHNFSSSIQ